MTLSSSPSGNHSPDAVDIRDAFPDLTIYGVMIEQTDGRYKPGAKITLQKPELLDDWPKSRQNVFILNKEVSVCIGSSDGWLCVAKLPLDYTDDQFMQLAESYGRVKEAFLMISEHTGESKGYGLIKYLSSDAAAQARHLLDGRVINSYRMDCDWLNSGHITFKSLHSKALFVDHLPPRYRDLGEFRKIFSVVRNPPYCQIAMPKGVIQDWGLVEFFDPEDSEITQQKLNQHRLKDQKIRVHFCIPGVNAINIYMQAVNAPADTKKKALMNDTPSANVYSQLQKLAGQNPNFAQNLQNIIQDQISSLSSGRSLLPGTIENVASEAATIQMSSPTMVSATPSLNSNAQAALMILLTAQMESQTGESSILQNPQVVGTLQSLVNQAANPSNQKDTSLNEILAQNPALDQVFKGPPGSQAQPQAAPQPQQARWNQGNGNTLIGPTAPSPPLYEQAKAALSAEQNHIQYTVPKDASPTPPIVANNLNNLLNTQNLNQLLGSLTNEQQQQQQQQQQAAPSISPAGQLPINDGLNSHQRGRRPSALPGQRPVLLGDPPAQHGGARPPLHPTSQSLHQALHPTVSVASGLGAQMANGLAAYQGLPAGAGLFPTPGNLHQNPYLMAGFQGIPMGNPSANPAFTYGANMTGASRLAMGPQPQTLLAAHSPYLTAAAGQQNYSAAAVATNAQYMAYFQQQQHQHQINFMNSLQHSAALSGMVATSPTVAITGYMPAPIGTAYSSPVSTMAQMGFATPPPNAGNKRKLPIPPSPEQSPEGPYIGQHSQGIGGHYADSYWRKRAKFE
eukprot:snap_masked-scaffold347_size200506-processed-gene-0.11 protein:Tk02316 transcript:snap_masked-scaffold347_size200506-processed-gene-0.11-mRNA-1 annotation:"ribonucleoprotein ptb-binding 1-like isoform x2"